MNQDKKNAEPRAHHYVPQCWLAGFTDHGTNDGRLFVTDLKRKKQWQSTPANTGHRRDFYRISVPEMESTAFESVFGRVESFVAPTLKKLLEKPQHPTREQLDKLLYFAAVQFVRVPAFRPTLLKISDSIHRAEISKALKSKESWQALLKDSGIPIDTAGADYDGMLAYQRNVINTGQYSLSADNDFFLMRGLDAVEKPIWPSLKARHWSTILSKDGKFIGSDNPVMMDGEKGKQVGFKSADVIFLIVNRFMMLCGTHQRMTSYGGKQDLLAFHNTFTMLTAHEQVYSHKPAFYWLNEVGKICTDWKLFSKGLIIEATPSS